MAYERNPDDPYRFPNDPYRSSHLDNELRADPELAEGPANGSKVAMFVLGIAVVLGAIFYGLNNSSINEAGTTSTAQNTQRISPPAAPPGMRDVTPRANTEAGTTTGAAPASPAAPPALANPPMNNNAPANR